MADRAATKDEVARWQKAQAKVDACAQVIAQATHQKEALDDAIERETILKDRRDSDLAALVLEFGGTPTPPPPGTTGDWTIKV